jgi:hypothetical protein
VFRKKDILSRVWHRQSQYILGGFMLWSSFPNLMREVYAYPNTKIVHPTVTTQYSQIQSDTLLLPCSKLKNEVLKKACFVSTM